MWKAPNGIGGTLTPIGPADPVRFVTNDFMYGGGDGYTVFSQGTNVLQPGDDLLQVSIDYVTAHSPVDPRSKVGSSGRSPFAPRHETEGPGDRALRLADAGELVLPDRGDHVAHRPARRLRPPVRPEQARLPAASRRSSASWKLKNASTKGCVQYASLSASISWRAWRRRRWARLVLAAVVQRERRGAAVWKPFSRYQIETSRSPGAGCAVPAKLARIVSTRSS